MRSTGMANSRWVRVNYSAFVAKKLTRQPPTGLAVVPNLHTGLFPFQKELVAWALRRGRCALFADTGLGKSRMQLEWARHIGGDVLVLAPLAVARQTVGEGRTIGLDVTLCRDGVDVRPGVNITNYDRLHRFDPSRFRGVVLDESSVIKHHNAKTLHALLAAFEATPFKLCATATPSPNDYTELGTHAEFLGVCTRSEMLSEFFCHDGGETQVWRLKGHARTAFWRWVASWAALLRKPSDLGYDDGGYDLPALTVDHMQIAADAETVKASGLLFAEEASTLTERRDARRGSIGARVQAAADIVNATTDPFVVWCDLNAESDALVRAIHGAIEIRGADDADVKEQRLADFAEGRARVLVSKSSICGWGLNWQHCNRVAFVGVTDSYEAFYQAVRRCWRFGQKRPVHVHVFASELEGAVIMNLRRKEADAQKMAEELACETRETVRAEVRGTERSTNDYAPSKRMTVPNWLTSDEGEAAE
jgi:superfamily II DNA or RNA helicase